MNNCYSNNEELKKIILPDVLNLVLHICCNIPVLIEIQHHNAGCDRGQENTHCADDLAYVERENADECVVAQTNFKSVNPNVVKASASNLLGNILIL